MGRPLQTMTFTQPKQVADVVKMEYEQGFTREVGVLKSGFSVLALGMVLGVISFGAVTSAVKASGANTGNGTCTPDVAAPVQVNAKAGIYTARCIAAATNSGTFEVKDPEGRSLGQVVVGATFNDQIKFVIADGATDFIVGDGFDITVAAGSGKYAPYDPTAKDGTQNAAAILLHQHDTTAADVAGAVLLVRGPAEIDRTGLAWGTNVTTNTHKDNAVAALAKLGIVSRVAA